MTDRQPVTFEELRRWLGARPDKKGRVPVTCPACGEARPDKCQMWPEDRTVEGDAGWHCFICGAGGTINGLAYKLGYRRPDDYRPAPQPVTPKPEPVRKAYAWQAQAETLTARYAAAGDRVALWQAYKPLPADVIARNRLGVGVLPASKCDQRRLIVPLVDFTGAVVGFRARLPQGFKPETCPKFAQDCKCAKWLSPGGNIATLYNWQAVRPGCTLYLIENAPDSLLFTHRYAAHGAVAAATLSVSYRDPAWLDWISRQGVRYFVVWYDNDAPGQAVRRDILRQWDDKHHSPPPLNGFKLYELLIERGMTGEVYRWPDDAPIKADPGDYLK